MTFTQSIREARSAGTTPKQAQVLAAISDLTAAHGYPPSIRRIARHLGVTVNDVYQKLVRLERDGAITKDAGECRSIRIREVQA